MESDKKFITYYNNLNKEQKDAVDTIDGPVMVVAGPGTGKTQILTLRIANILRQTDTSPDSILALTFTTSGVYSMRKRLVEIIGSAGYRVNITTFHSFCNDVIQDFPEEFPGIIGSTSATKVDQVAIISRAIEDLPLKTLKPYGDTFYYLKPALSEIERMKRENISPEALEDLIKKQEADFAEIPDLYHEKGVHKGKMKGKYKDIEKKIEKNKELASIYSVYEEKMHKEKLYDFGDMVLSVIRRLEENEDLLLRLQEEYQYILADEHQDANGAQNKLLELLSGFHENPNLFIVGDEKQAIFQFQGASLDNFEYFQRLYPEAEKITLSQNYRSTQSILDSAHSMISKSKYFNSEQLAKLSATKGDTGVKIKVAELETEEDEALFLVGSINEAIKEVDSSEIAILFRDNKDAISIAPYLKRAGIPIIIESDENVLDDEDLRKVVLIIKAIVYFGDEEALIKALHVDFLGLDPLDIYKVIAEARREKKHSADIIKRQEKLEKLDLEDKEKLFDIFVKLKDWHTKAHNKNATDMLELIIEGSNFLEYIMALPDAPSKIEKLRNFFNEAKTLVGNHRNFSLFDFISYLELLENHNIPLKGGIGARPSGVRLMTAHRSKGMEFERVYIIGARDGHWGNKRKSNTFSIPTRGSEKVGENTLEDERRLFYVALTRAKQEVVISYSSLGREGKHHLPCQFIEEIDPDLVEKVNASVSIKKGEELDMFKPAPVDPVIPLKNKEMLNRLFYDRGLSVSALNNFLECPWRYFFLNLVRLPRQSTKHAMYGTAVHEALRYFFDIYNDRSEGTKEELLALFESHLNRMPLSENDFAESLERGKEALSGYYDTYKNLWPRPVINEFNVKGVEIVPGVKLTGKLDKMEFFPDESRVNVVDYKTASPKSRNDIEGNTKTSNGNYKRQLVFYKLLLDHYDGGRYRMESGEIDFVEPDKKSGKFRKEKFVIEDSEVKELENLTKDVINQILSLSFWDKTCSDPKCEFCSLRKMMKSS